MSYKIEKPLSIQERANFIVEYNHNKGLRIEETDVAIYALEAWEGINKAGEVVDNTEAYEVQNAQAERECIAKLNLTGADVERGIYQAKGMDFDDILALVIANPPEGLDIKALKIELKANNFYRGNHYVNVVGSLLGFTGEQLDKFFETNDYNCLLTKEVEVND